jgi:hypothetical protein
MRASRAIVGIGTHKVEATRNLRTKILNGCIALEAEGDTLGGSPRVHKVDEHLGIATIAPCVRDAEHLGVESALARDGPDELTEFFKIQCHDSHFTCVERRGRLKGGPHDCQHK